MICVRFLKYPYVFWATTKPYEVEFDVKSETIKANNNIHKFVKMEKWKFLILKYTPFFFFVAIFYNRYDLSMETSKIFAYIFAFAYMLPMFFINHEIIRRALVFTILIVCIGISFHLGNLNIAAFSIKYFILIFGLFLFLSDLKTHAFSIVNNEGKVVSGFLLNDNDFSQIFLKNKDKKNA
ncbi:hypothetical protein [Campylobacter jejuni]|uniref:hypothetical protein n=1 Tax=Campylobacter jejuni TaxID=197 RepID=UPI000892F994|nr:hypothetical protein [Campylobacter jejuni]OEZ15042.1 hypothetical protein A0L49_08675 [Campylobacter jejuni]